MALSSRPLNTDEIPTACTCRQDAKERLEAAKAYHREMATAPMAAQVLASNELDNAIAVAKEWGIEWAGDLR